MFTFAFLNNSVHFIFNDYTKYPAQTYALAPPCLCYTFYRKREVSLTADDLALIERALLAGAAGDRYAAPLIRELLSR